MSSPQPGVGSPNQEAMRLQIEQALKGSASWFVVIAGLSILNSVLSMSGAKITFIFGLGLTQIVDAIAHGAGGAGFALDLVVNGVIAGVFVLFWNFARKGEKWAFLAGMGLYAVDGLILLPFKDYLAIAFHAWALYRMYNGVKLLPALEQLKRQQESGALTSSM